MLSSVSGSILGSSTSTMSAKPLLTSSAIDAFTRTSAALDLEGMTISLRIEIVNLEKELEACGDVSEAMKNKSLWFKRQSIVAELATKRNELAEAEDGEGGSS